MNKQIEEKFRKSSTRVKSLAFHPNQPVFITGNHCGSIYIWNYQYQQPTAVLNDHTGSVRTVKFHPTGEFFASAGDDKIVRVWNYKTKEVLKRLKGHTDYIRSVDFHPTQPWIISGSDDSTIKVWNYYTGDMLCTSSGHHHYVMAVLFVDSTHIVTGSLDHTLGLWNCSNLFEKAKKFMVPSVIMSQTIDAHDRGVNSLYMKDGLILSGSDDHEIKIWKYSNENLTLSKTLYANDGNVTGVFIKDEIVYGVSEDGSLAVYNGENRSKIKLDSRAWCISGKDEYIGVGTDDGLIVFRYSPTFVYCNIEGDYFYVKNRGIYMTNSKDSEKLIYKLGRDKVLSISPAYVNSAAGKENKSKDVQKYSILIQYEDKYEILEDGRASSGDLGFAVVSDPDIYKLQNTSLYKNGTLLKQDASGRLVMTESHVFLVHGKSVTLISDQELSFSPGFEVLSISYSKTLDLFAFIGSEKIAFADSKLNLKHTITELVEITGGIFSNQLFIYTTIKQIKYFYSEPGIFQSVDSYIRPIGLENNELFFIGYNGIDKISINMGEVTFRDAVMKDEDILSVIEREQLPGLSPLEYLIKNGKGIVALPYIQDKAKQFSLYLSDNNFIEAYKVCESDRMYSELALKALENLDYEIAEKCLKKTKDFIRLFYLYLCTKQFEKMVDLEGDEVNSMVKLVLEDDSIFTEDIVDPVYLGKRDKGQVGSLNQGSLNSKKDEKISLKDNSSAHKKARDFSDHSKTADKIKASEVNSKMIDGKVSENNADENAFIMDNSLLNDKEKSTKDSKNTVNSSINEFLKKENSPSKKSVNLKNREEKTKKDSTKDLRDRTINEEVLTDVENSQNPVDCTSNPTSNNLVSHDVHLTNGKIKNISSDEDLDSDNIIQPNGTSESIQHDGDLNVEIESLIIKSPNSKIAGVDIDISDDIASTKSSQKTSYATCNDSDPGMSIFDPSLAKELCEPADVDQTVDSALEKTTKGLFPDALVEFRKAIVNLALSMKSQDDHLVLRRKIGNYIHGLSVEIERKKVSDPKKMLEMSMFFCTLDLEKKHKDLAKGLAMNLNFKNGNYKTAKALAADIKDNINAKKVLNSSKSDDAIPLDVHDILFDTNEADSKSLQCPLCFVKSKRGEVCGACLIGLLE